MRLIDADELYDVLLDTYGKAKMALLKDILEYIDESTTIEAELVKQGKWIEKPYLFGTTNYCSLCENNYGMPHERYNFCPNCGAKMDLEVEE